PQPLDSPDQRTGRRRSRLGRQPGRARNRGLPDQAGTPDRRSSEPEGEHRMTPRPTGRLFPAQTGRDLVLTRTYRAPIEDVWASITESDRTARWFGPWEGEAGPGKTIKVQMAFEDDEPWMDMRIDACEPPRHLGVSAEDEAGSWFLDVELTETDGSTELRFT